MLEDFKELRGLCIVIISPQISDSVKAEAGNPNVMKQKLHYESYRLEKL